MTLTQGIHYNVPFQDYLWVPGINQSDLKKFGRAKSPAHYKWEKDHPDDKEKSVSLKIGTYVDSQMFDTQRDQSDMLTRLELDTAINCVMALKQHADTQKILSACQRQVVVIADNPMRKGMIDLLPDEDRCDPLLLDYVFDLKTAADASQEGFTKACHKFGYHIQAAFYMDLLRAVGRDVKTFAFIVVETKPPYAIAIHYMPRESLEIETGQYLYRKWMKEYQECVEKNEWPGYGDSWSRVQFKPWQFKETDEPERTG